MKKTSILLVDDHAVVRMGLSAIINLQADLKVCGEAENGEAAVRLAAELKPDVVVMDFSLPGMDGAEATAAVLKASPLSKILILTSFGTSSDLDELSSAIRDTARGIQHFSPEIRQTLSEGTDDKAFTKRQMEVLDSITRGLSNDDIALMLGISKSRVKQHLNEVYEKLGASNRAEAVAIAMRRQLLKS